MEDRGAPAAESARYHPYRQETDGDAMDGMPKEWETAVGRMHRVVEDGRTLTWPVRKVLGSHNVDLGKNGFVCPLRTKPADLALLATAPVLASLVDAAVGRASSGDGNGLSVLKEGCREAVGSTPVGPWRLDAARRSGVRSVVLMSPTAEIGFLPIERQYLQDNVEETVASLAVAATAPELMAACICLADDPKHTDPCRFAVDAVVANLRRASLLVPPRRGRAKGG